MEMILQDFYSQPNIPDNLLDDSLVLDIVREFVPSAIRIISVDESGGEARVYAVDDDIILKTQRPHKLRPRTSLQKEVFMLREIEKQSDISVPRVLGYTRRSDFIECTVMTRMPGSAIIRTEMSKSEMAAALFIHGMALKKLHSLDQKPFVDSGLFPNDKTSDNVKKRFLYRFNLALKAMEKDIVKIERESIEQLGKEIIMQVPENLKLVALHSNPYKEHVFVSNDKSYSGMIDFGDAYISHSVNDMRRWSLEERGYLFNGYTSIGIDSDGFLQMWDIVYQIDALLDILKLRGSIADIGSKNDLLKWK